MKLVLKPEINFDSLQATLKEKFPQYQVTKKKNPITKWEYVEVRKSAGVGVWVRIFPNKNEFWLIKCIPSTAMRALFGGLLFLAFVVGAQGKLQKEVADVLKAKFNTTEA